jgi:hypothetical protein
VVENLVDDRLILDTGDYLGFTSALSAMRLAPQLGQNPLRLQLNTTKCS